jgi:hypothetical protein
MHNIGDKSYQYPPKNSSMHQKFFSLSRKWPPSTTFRDSARSGLRATLKIGPQVDNGWTDIYHDPQVNIRKAPLLPICIADIKILAE